MVDTVKDGILGYTVPVTMENGSIASAFVPYHAINQAVLAALQTKPTPAATATKTSPAASASAISIFAANANRLPGSTVVNDSTAIMYILLGAGTVSATNFTLALDGKTTVPGVYFVPDGWTGIVTAIWATATGNARNTEISA